MLGGPSKPAHHEVRGQPACVPPTSHQCRETLRVTKKRRVPLALWWPSPTRGLAGGVGCGLSRHPQGVCSRTAASFGCEHLPWKWHPPPHSFINRGSASAW